MYNYGKKAHMARPRKDSGEPPAQLRLEEAFWELFANHPVDKITVNMIVSKAGCSRGSFYYHYTDMDDLTDEIVTHTFPDEIPYILLRMVTTKEKATVDALAHSHLREKVDRLCLLLGPNSTMRIIGKVRQAIFDAWLKALGFEEETMPREARIVLEFVINGVTGVLSYRVRSEREISIDECFNAVFPEIPEGFLKRINAIMGRPVA